MLWVAPRLQQSVTFSVATADNGKKRKTVQNCQVRSNGQELRAEVKQGKGVTGSRSSVRSQLRQIVLSKLNKVFDKYPQTSGSTSQYEPAG